MHLSRLLAPALLMLALPVAHAQTSVHLGLRLGLNAATRSGTEPVTHPDTGSGTYPSTSTYSQDYTRSAVLAPQFGAVLDVRFGHLALQPAVLFSQKGVDQRNHINYSTTYNSPISGISSRVVSEEKYQFTSRPNYVEIPLNVAYTFGDDHGFQVFGGPYVAFGVGGQVQYEAERQYNYGYGNGQSSGSNYSYGSSFYQFRDTYPEPTLKQPNTNNGPTTYSTSFGDNSAPSISRRFDAGLNLGVGYRQGPLQVQLGYGLGLVNQQVAKASNQREDLTAYYQRVAQLTATYFLKVK